MFRLIWAASVRTHSILSYAPTNLLLAAIRTRRGLKWGVPAMLLAVPYLLLAKICTNFMADGGPGWGRGDWGGWGPHQSRFTK